ncbi:MAG TPA: DinB family protein [Candidatus Acidoferrales bacterium]|nr:DinB family protein [Candidatus Acidoferrales bacterium]
MKNLNHGICAHVLILVCALLVCAAGAGAQAGKATPASSTITKDLVKSWNEIGGKLTAMAEDFPEDKYDWKPTPEVRSFAEQLLHAAGYANYVGEVSKGLRPKEEDPPRANFKTKADIVAYVKKAYADGAKAIEATGDEKLKSSVQIGRWTVTLYGLWDSVVEHSGEHYGQLVLYYRVNKMVPPESRPRK